MSRLATGDHVMTHLVFSFSVWHALQSLCICDLELGGVSRWDLSGPGGAEMNIVSLVVSPAMCILKRHYQYLGKVTNG